MGMPTAQGQQVYALSCLGLDVKAQRYCCPLNEPAAAKHNLRLLTMACQMMQQSSARDQLQKAISWGFTDSAPTLFISNVAGVNYHIWHPSQDLAFLACAKYIARIL